MLPDEYPAETIPLFLQIEGDPVFQEVDIMSVDIPGYDLFLKRLLGKASPLFGLPRVELDVEVAGNADLAPSAGIQHIIKLFGDLGLVSAGLPKIVRSDAQLTQAVHNLAPLRRKCLCDNLKRVIIAVKFKLL